MPRKDIDYSKTILYKIVCNDINIKDVYVGQTTDFTRRKWAHRSTCNILTEKIKLYDTIRNNGGWENWAMIEIEKYPCIDSNEAHARERYWLETLNATLNQRTPITTDEEKKEYNKKFHTENQDILKEKRKVYNQKEEIKLKNIERTTKYRENNKDAILARQRASTINCDCGSIYRSCDKAQHLKSVKHIMFASPENISKLFYTCQCGSEVALRRNT